MVVLSWCTGISSEGDMGMETGLTAVLSARMWVPEHWDVSWKVAGKHRDPLKSPKQITYSILGFPKIPGFCLSSSHSIPCAGKESPKAPHVAVPWLAHTVLPAWAPGEASAHLKTHPVVMPGGCEAGTRSAQGSVLPTEQRGAAEVPVQRQASLRCLCQPGDPGAPTGLSTAAWAASAGAGTSQGAS